MTLELHNAGADTSHSALLSFLSSVKPHGIRSPLKCEKKRAEGWYYPV